MIDLDHPCKQTCSGWKQGYERGLQEMQTKLEKAECDLRAEVQTLKQEVSRWKHEAAIAKEAANVFREVSAGYKAKLDCATETLRLISAFQHRVVISNADTLRQSELADAALTKIGKEDAMVSWTYRDKAIVPGVGHD